MNHWPIRPRSVTTPSPVVLVDTIGELGAWWGTASIGFVGGTFGSRGGQNMIEPAAYGVATCFGPNTRNFRDIVGQLLAAEAAEVVQDPAALTTFVRRALEDARWAHGLGRRARVCRHATRCHAAHDQTAGAAGGKGFWGWQIGCRLKMICGNPHRPWVICEPISRPIGKPRVY